MTTSLPRCYVSLSILQEGMIDFHGTARGRLSNIKLLLTHAPPCTATATMSYIHTYQTIKINLTNLHPLNQSPQSIYLFILLKNPMLKYLSIFSSFAMPYKTHHLSPDQFSTPSSPQRTCNESRKQCYNYKSLSLKHIEY